MDSFIEKFQKDLSKLKPNTNRNNDNLTKPERQALDQLKLRKDIIIMRADKGGAVVKEENRQLNNTNYYAELSYDPTKQHEEITNETIKTFTKEKLLPEQLGKNLLQNNSNTPNMYFLPNIHKTNNPGRPIVSSIGSPTAKISHFVILDHQNILSNLYLLAEKRRYPHHPLQHIPVYYLLYPFQDTTHQPPLWQHCPIHIPFHHKHEWG